MRPYSLKEFNYPSEPVWTASVIIYIQHKRQLNSDGWRATTKEESFHTLPAGLAGGLDADLHQHVLRGSVLSAVVGGHGQFIHALFAIAQFFCVLDKA